MIDFSYKKRSHFLNPVLYNSCFLSKETLHFCLSVQEISTHCVQTKGKKTGIGKKSIIICSLKN